MKIELNRNTMSSISVGASTCESSLSEQVIPYLPKWKNKSNSSSFDSQSQSENGSSSSCSSCCVPSLVCLSSSSLARNFVQTPLDPSKCLPLDLAKLLMCELSGFIDPRITVR
mmetsp:Transcript_13901/g.17486  ORF Transcript_13901/g.17486 Transcript_13901/m.17486 type:complete len:113 (+) Transcript_13901:27-365(+)